MNDSEWNLPDIKFRHPNDQIDHLIKEAEHGNAAAMVDLCLAYYSGDGVSQNEGKALEWLKRALEMRDPDAQVLMGEFYNEGIMVEEDHEKAFDWYYKAAMQAHPEGKYRVGHAYMEGIGTEEDPHEGIGWIRDAAEAEFPEAMLYLGKLYEQGTYVKQDYEKALKWYVQAAALENNEAQKAVGDVFANGLGVTKDLDMAYRWYEAAANSGNAEACGKMGYACMHFILGFARHDYEKAVEWLEKGVEGEDGTSMFLLGQMYMDGKVTGTPDIDKALTYYEDAANHDEPQALCELGYMCLTGTQYVQKDVDMAFKMLHRASELDYKAAHFIIGKAYYEGVGVAVDKDRALDYFLDTLGNEDNEVYEYLRTYLLPEARGNNGFDREVARRKIEERAFYKDKGDVNLAFLLTKDRSAMYDDTKDEKYLKEAQEYVRDARRSRVSSPELEKLFNIISHKRHLLEEDRQIDQEFKERMSENSFDQALYSIWKVFKRKK